MEDLTRFAGFQLEFNPSTLEIDTGNEFVFDRSIRYGKDIKPVLYCPNQVKPYSPIYMTDILKKAPSEANNLLEKYNLMFSLVLLPSLKIGDEFVKTTGHYHPPIPGTTLGYPEVYTQLFGTLLLLLQRRSVADPQKILDFKIFEMTPGFVITIPPNYAHCLVNPTNEPALMAGLYGKSFKPDYSMTFNRHGLAYYILAGEDGKTIRTKPNLAYPYHPMIEYVNNLEGTYFSPDYYNQPIWTSFMLHSENYAFLTDPKAAKKKFPDWM